MIRLATLEDMPAILDLLLEFHAENGFAPLNLDKVKLDVSNLIENLDLFVAYIDEALVGLLGIEDNVLRYSDHHVLVDAYFFVGLKHRGGTIGLRLMQAATLEAERRGLPLYIRVSNPTRARRGRVSEIVGYFPAGYVVRLR